MPPENICDRLCGVMANNAQNSQNKSDNLGRGRVAYAFKVSRVNPDFVSFKVWILGYYSKVCSIAVSSLPKIVAQIDTALAEGDCEFEIGGIRFSADEKLLKSIRKEFSSYCCNEGVSDANNVPGASRTGIEGVNPLRRATPRLSPRLESPTGSTKQKASAPACKPSARQICKLTTTETGEADASAVADGLIQAFREALRAELAPIRAVLDELSTILNEERKTKNEELSTPAGVVQRRDGAKGKNSSFLILNSSLPKTRRGRTSVIVGVRKVSTTKKQK